MEMSLFSSFDPTVADLGQLKWLSAVSLAFFFLKFFTLPVGWLSFIFFFMKQFFLVLKEGVFFLKNKSVFLVAVFFLILINVEMGFVPFVFVNSGQMSFNLAISFPLWLGSVFFMVYSSWREAVAHLVPFGSPLILTPVLTLIETISVVIRPFTLSIRLMTNIMAGHMIVSLIEMAVPDVFFLVGWSMVIVECGLFGFEMMVSVVQAYVFSNLLFLYWKEAEHG